MSEITMPRLSDSMEEGTILAWIKPSGANVAVGEDLVEIETDKATLTYQSPVAGVLTLIAEPGETLPVGALIATVGGEPPPPVVTPAAGAEPARPAVSRAPRGEPFATPMARRLATMHCVELGGVQGTGPSGRITRADVAARAGIELPAAPVEPPPRPAPTRTDYRGEVSVEELSRLQRVVARRMSEAKSTAPEFQVQTDVEMGPSLELRERLMVTAGDVVPSINDLIVKAAALALREFPRANGSYVDGRFELYSRVNVGVAVAAEDALIVPTIHDADRLSLGAIASQVRRLVERVRTGAVTPDELDGSTFTVSNLGMYGMTAITPVLNLPNAAILGVGAVRVLPALADGRLIERQLMTLTLSCDHRILYGADAAEFLRAIADRLEQPARLL